MFFLFLPPYQFIRVVSDEKIRGSLQAKHYILEGMVGVGSSLIQWVVVFCENVIL